MICKSDKQPPLKLTNFQWRVLRLLRVFGPTDYDGLRAHCHRARAVKKAVYRLRTLGLASRVSPGAYDVSDQGRELFRLGHQQAASDQLQ